MATKKLLKGLLDVAYLDILGDRYDLVFSPRMAITDEGSCGCVNFIHQKLYIDTSIGDGKLCGVILHEVMEAIAGRYTVLNVEAPLTHVGLTSLEYGITEFFRNNPKFGKLYIEFISSTKGNTYENGDFGVQIYQSEAEEVFAKLTKEKASKSSGGRQKKTPKRVVKGRKGKG